MSDVVLYEATGGVATVTLNRPDKYNAMNWDLITAFDEALNRAAADDEVRCVVLAATGKHFCVGDDLQEAWTGDAFEKLMARFRDHPDEPEFDRIFTYPKPLVVAVHGYCFAGALELILWADVLVASDDAQFATQFVQYGLTAGSVTFYRLPRLIGHSNASYMLLSGERVGAEDALRMGLVTKVVPRDELLGEAQRIAGAIAAHPPEAVATTRQGIQVSLRANREGTRDITVYANQALHEVFKKMGAVQ